MAVLTDDQLKDLRPVQVGEKIKIGGWFYRKDENEFHVCMISEEDLKNDNTAYLLKEMTKKFIREGRIFTRINKPWHSFSGLSGGEEYIIPVFDAEGHRGKNYGIYSKEEYFKIIKD